jgi:hypothetical protein
MQRVQSDLLLVGSIPLTSAAEVFETSYRYLGPYLASLPDGETGPRTIWIGYLARDVYDGHPDISTVQKLDVNKPTSFNDTSNRWIFRLKDPKVCSVPGDRLRSLCRGFLRAIGTSPNGREGIEGSSVPGLLPIRRQRLRVLL